MEDRSALFNQLKSFSQRKLKKVETKVVTASGEQLVEKRGAKGLQVLSGADAAKNEEAEPPRKLDLQVGLVLPGFLLGSNDVAHDKNSLESYGITHILSLDSGVENKFEDDYNYKNVNIHDKPDFELDKVFEDCFDFIDDGRHYGNVLIHCSGTIGLSRSTAICIAYLMDKEKQKFDDAFNNVKEARSFVRPNEGFIKQLKDFEVKLRGAQQVKESGIDDPFALRKKQEIEQEKAMVAGAASVKNRMKMFGATLDTGSGSRSKSVSPLPAKTHQTPNSQAPAASRWGANKDSIAAAPTDNKSISKSMTPEPKRSWRDNNVQEQGGKNDWQTSSKPSQVMSGGPPPPPPPLPPKSLHDDKSIKPVDSSASARAAALPPPPPPPPSSQAGIDFHSSKKVFGKVPPPPMKIKGGLSIERQDSVSERNISGYKTNQSSKSSLKLPLKKQFTTDSGSESETADSRAPSPSAALRAAKQQVAAAKQGGQMAEKTNLISDAPRPSVCGQLNRSSTKKLLNLIKTKTKTDLTLPDGDENDEIEALLGALENEQIDHIDWDELGLDEDEVKGIIQQGVDTESDSSDSEDGSEEEDEEEEEEVETSTQHYVIRSK